MPIYSVDEIYNTVEILSKEKIKFPYIFVNDDDGVVWTFLDAGANNAAYQGVIDGRKWVLRFCLDSDITQNKANAPARLVKNLNQANKKFHYKYPKAKLYSVSNLKRNGFIMPFVPKKNILAGTDHETYKDFIKRCEKICDFVIDYACEEQRVLADAFIYGNVFEDPDGHMILIDAGDAFIFEKVEKRSQDSLDQWIGLQEQYQELFKKCEKRMGYNLVVKTIKALLFMALYYPDIRDVSVLKGNKVLQDKLSRAYDTEGKDISEEDIKKYFNTGFDEATFEKYYPETKDLQIFSGFSKKEIREIYSNAVFGKEHIDVCRLLIEKKNCMPAQAMNEVKKLNLMDLVILKELWDFGLRYNHIKLMKDNFKDDLFYFVFNYLSSLAQDENKNLLQMMIFAIELKKFYCRSMNIDVICNFFTSFFDNEYKKNVLFYFIEKLGKDIDWNNFFTILHSVKDEIFVGTTEENVAQTIKKISNPIFYKKFLNDVLAAGDCHLLFMVRHHPFFAAQTTLFEKNKIKRLLNEPQEPRRLGNERYKNRFLNPPLAIDFYRSTTQARGDVRPPFRF